MHEWHLNNKAEFENVGQWKRAWYYPKNNEKMFDAVQREIFGYFHLTKLLEKQNLLQIIKMMQQPKILNQL